MDPDNSPSLLVAAKLLTRLGKKQEAMARYDSMVAKDPKSTVGHMDIAALFVAEGSNDKAIEQYTNILQINDKNVWRPTILPG